MDVVFVDGGAGKPDLKNAANAMVPDAPFSGGYFE